MQYDVDFAVPFRHRVRFTQDLAGNEFEVLLDLIEPSDDRPAKALVVLDDSVSGPDSVATQIVRRLAASPGVSLMDCQSDCDNAPTEALLIEGGESCKNDRKEVDRVLAQIDHFNLDRRSYVVVIGGGAVLDAVGYAAAVAHRGIRLIRIPTTTLAQDDSGVGVKNAINFFDKKNWVGSFAVPWGVINDASILESLGDRDFRCGFSEAVKVSLLKSNEDFEFLCSNAKSIHDRDMEIAFDAIQRSCLWHLRHITQGGDPFESLEARPLDFGHWSAHRMEPLSDYQIRHGEAVGIGVMLDCIYSCYQHGFPASDVVKVYDCLRGLGLPLWHDVLDDARQLLIGLEEFRQHLGGRLTVTMLEGVAQPINVHEIDTEVMLRSLEDLKQWYQAGSVPLAGGTISVPSGTADNTTADI